MINLPTVSVSAPIPAMTAVPFGWASTATPTRGELAIYLPDVAAIPPALRGTAVIVGNLLTSGTDNPKLAKSDKARTKFRTFALTLSPSRSSGFQTCGSASDGCIKACLNTSGMGWVFPSIHVSRIAKTVALFVRRELFLERLRRELRNLVKRAKREGFRAAVRLNVMSDVMWERIAPGLMGEFPTIQFYDYTKHAARMLRFCAGEFPRNYYLTFSRSECNGADVGRVLAAGGNVTVVFASKALPETWNGRPVVSGDETDMRFRDKRDPAGVIIGLYAKGVMGKRDDSGFVIR